MRKKPTTAPSLSARRAWIEMIIYIMVFVNLGSLSARRAWIEMLNPHHPAKLVKSLSARRAWIEIIECSYHNIKLEVALRKESVDRNFCLFVLDNRNISRSPQGERG